MNIDIEKLKKLTEEAGKIFLTPEGEETLVELLKIKEQVETAIDTAEKILEETALSVNPNFSSIQADRVKVFYRSYGARYRVDPTNLDKLPKNFYKTRVAYDVIADEVEKWTENHKGLPLGVNEIERPKSLKFGLKAVK